MKRSTFDDFRRPILEFRRPDLDPRSVCCPRCVICSCQICSHIWFIGSNDHSELTCETYATKLESISNDDAQLLDQWRSSHNVRRCQKCRATIEKRQGCQYMTCRCRYEFCWVFGKLWTSSHLLVSCQAPPPGLLHSKPHHQQTQKRGEMNIKETGWWTLLVER